MFSLEQLLMYAVGFILVTVGGYGIRLLKKKGVLTQLKQQELLVNIVVKSVQQSYGALGGEQKLAIAKKQLVEMANHNGIKIKEEQVDHVINSTVKQLKAEFGEAWNK